MMKYIEDLIENQKTVFLTSVDSDGFPEVRAMLFSRKREGLRRFYFTTNTSSSKVEQYLKNDKAFVYFCDSLDFKGVMLKGHMEILHDIASKQMILRDDDEIYYPNGVADPDYCVLRFAAINCRYYSDFKVCNFDIQ